jgi:hypothetical protein
LLGRQESAERGKGFLPHGAKPGVDGGDFIQRGVRGGGVPGGAGFVEGGPERGDGAVVFAMPGGEGGEVLVKEEADAIGGGGIGEFQRVEDGAGVFRRLGGRRVCLGDRGGRDRGVAGRRVGGAGAEERD